MKELQSLNKYFLKYKWHLLGGILFVTISNLFGIFPAQLTRNALDVVAANIDTYHLLDGYSSQESVYKSLVFNILLFGVLVLSMALMKGIFMFFMRQTIIVMSRHIEYDMKNEVFGHYQRLGLDFYNRNNTGDLMNRISEDVGRVRMYVGPAIMYSINLLVMFVLVIWAMYSVNARLATFVLIPLPVMSMLVYYVHDRINRKSEAVQEKLSDLSTFVQEAFSGIRLIKAYAREKQYLGAYKQQTEAYSNLSMELVKVNAMFMPTMLLLVGVSTILTIYVGGLEVIKGNITVGNIAEFVIYVNMLTWPVASLGWVISIIQRAAASQQRLNEFLKEEPGIVSGDLPCKHIEGNLEFRNVSVKYDADRNFALENVSFKISAGESVGVIGRTGSGKSTLVNVLLRLVDPVNGEVLIDGQPLRSLHLDDYRKQIGCVPQDVFLFSDTIKENIAFGLEGKVEEKAVEEAARAAVVYDNIVQFPLKFDTMVGERGITLSGGQKQRVSIARAIIRNPDVLIFDDCLSAVDTITEEKILSNLTNIMKGKTSVLVSHRVATVKACNRILVLEEGRLAEEGTHESLLARNGLYRQLFELQLKENKTSMANGVDVEK
ncbi:MAG: ABC transporter ATP-binding protein [Bacteroidia bacterium]|nr:ABC transporter ATP-binding protein [Bacteroidia bacterium]